MCIIQAFIFGTAGAILTSYTTLDPTACLDIREANKLGVTYTVIGILFASVAG